MIHRSRLPSPRQRFTCLALWIACGGFLITAAGCETTLEDGYKPHALNATADARKGYYASPFSDPAAKHETGPGLGLGTH
jgi:hypothetical protein